MRASRGRPDVVVWSALIAAQVMLSEFKFELLVDEGGRFDSVRRLVQALVFFLPIVLLAVRSAALERLSMQRPQRAAVIWMGWGFLSVFWSVVPSETLIVMTSVLGLWTSASWYVWNFGFGQFARVYVASTSVFMFAGLLYDLTLVPELGLLRRFEGVSLYATNLGRMAMVTALISLVLLLEYGWGGLSCLASLAISITTLVTSGTRTALGVFVVGLLLFAYRRLGVVRALSIAAVLLVSGFVASLLTQDTVEFVSRAEGGEEITSLHGRTDIWDAALSAISERPVLGAGVGTTPELFALANSRGELVILAGHAHNLLLGQLMTMGIVGLGLFLAMIGSYFGVRSSQSQGLPPTPSLVPIILISMLLAGVTEAIFNRPTALFLVLGALYTQRSGAGARPETPTVYTQHETLNDREPAHG